MSNDNNTNLSVAGAILGFILALALIFLGVWFVSDGLAGSLDEGVSFGRTAEVLAGLYLLSGVRRGA